MIFARNSKGFTITELMVATGISSIVFYLIFSTVTQMKKQQVAIEKSILENIDTMLGDRAMMLDLKNIDPSFNNLVTIKDDSGANFFDYFHDIAPSQLSNKSRNLTLSLNKTAYPVSTNQVFFMTIDERVDGQISVVVDPVSAYIVGPQPKFDKPASLTYKGLDTDSPISSRVTWWKPGRLILLESIAKLRPPGSITNVVPARNPTFFGRVAGKDAEADGVINQYINTRAPWNNGLELNSPDKFLRNLPTANGGIPKVFIKPLVFIKFYLVAPPEGSSQSGSVLYRQYYTGTGWVEPILIATNVVAVKFERSLVTEKKVSFSIIKGS